jgi:hypothetical protein
MSLIEVISVLLVSLAIIGAAGVALLKVWLERTGRINPYIFLKVEVYLRFQDNLAHKATYVTDREVRANNSGIRDFWFTHIEASEGAVKNMLVDNEPPELFDSRFGRISLGKHFPDPVARGTVFRVKQSSELLDTFPEDTESYTYNVATKTDKVLIRVEFHPERPCKAARVYLHPPGFGSPRRLLEPGVSRTLIETSNLRRTEDGHTIEYTVQPKVGHAYELEWDW